MWGEPAARASAGRKDVMAVSPAPDNDKEADFADKLRRFDAADKSFRHLVESLAAYKTALVRAAECGVTVAIQMDAFFTTPRDRDRKQLASKFLDSQTAIRAKWLGEAEKTFDADVLAPIKSRLDEIPKVRDYIKARGENLAAKQKLQKKLQSERKRDGSRMRDKRRRLDEISQRFDMFHDEVIQRFDYIDRNMGTFVTAPLRSLISVMSEVAGSTAETLEEVSKLVAETPPITKELSPSAPMTTLADEAGGIVDQEAWDDSYTFEDDDDEGNFEREMDDADTDSTGARASARRPPRGRVQSADAVSKAPNVSLSGIDTSLGLDLASATSPRHGRTAISTPTDGTTVYSPTFSLPLASSLSGGPQRDSNGAPGSVSGRTSHHGHEPYYLPSVGTSAASSTSTENINSGTGLRGSSSVMESIQRRHRRDGKASGDTIESTDQNSKNEVLMRLIAIYDYFPQESNELEMHVGDVIEVSFKNESGWWCGRCGKSKGFFPRNYTRELTEQEELDYLAERRRRKRRGHRRQESHESRRSGQTASQSSVAVL